MAVANSNDYFTYVNIRAFGKESDSQVLQNSYCGKLSKKKKIPKSQVFPDSMSQVRMPCVLVGDETFGLSKHVRRLFAGKHLTEKKRILNYHITLARRYVECTFGILSSSEYFTEQWIRIWNSVKNISRHVVFYTISFV
ncbi:hypothetical protein PGB90_001597 [Kerria lacca]